MQPWLNKLAQFWKGGYIWCSIIKITLLLWHGSLLPYQVHYSHKIPSAYMLRKCQRAFLPGCWSCICKFFKPGLCLMYRSKLCIHSWACKGTCIRLLENCSCEWLLIWYQLGVKQFGNRGIPENPLPMYKRATVTWWIAAKLWNQCKKSIVIYNYCNCSRIFRDQFM